jgi:hypothetical protein
MRLTPKRLSISPGTIAIHPETVYNVNARTQDFWRASESLFLLHTAGVMLKHALSNNKHWFTTESVSFLHVLQANNSR